MVWARTTRTLDTVLPANFSLRRRVHWVGVLQTPAFVRIGDGNYSNVCLCLCGKFCVVNSIR
ncbi:hypothetical protein CY34DRAFT_797021 [Suillus luteus UH-Slu-Lm8-n1]|uniref:Uncharacterized protein n=1 Tax=Suillus luteus UH-Slu-Lm8-n1 TaxID=930992 RepID=A0A0D0BVL4_9AGAM|nr:hypothetical protein CY34DRAFT_797021 [Suillus luteus UH-Slu-Lm8-n1]